MRLRVLAILACAAIVTGGIAGARLNRSSRPTLHLHQAHAPATATTLPVSPEVTDEPTSTAAPPPSLPPPSQPPQPPPAPPSGPATYVVQPGDTLASIGAAHGGLDWWALCYNNHLQANCNLIFPGQVLELDGTAPPAPPPAPPSPPPSAPPQSQPPPGAQHPQPPPSSTCAQVVADVNAHGLFLPGNFRFICPGQALYGTAKAGPGIQAGGCPCSQASGVTYFGDGPEGPGPYVSIAHVTPYIVAYEFCNANLRYDPATGNSHDRQSGGTLSPSTADCVAAHGISQ